VVQVLQCIPDNWSLGLIHQFLMSSVRKMLNRSRSTRVERMLLRGDNLAARLQTFLLTRDPFYMTEDRQVVLFLQCIFCCVQMTLLSAILSAVTTTTYIFIYTLLVPLFSSVFWCCWLGGRKGIRPVKNWVVGYWRGYLSGTRCRLAYGPADATATHCLLLQ